MGKKLIYASRRRISELGNKSTNNIETNPQREKWQIIRGQGKGENETVQNSKMYFLNGIPRKQKERTNTRRDRDQNFLD